MAQVKPLVLIPGGYKQVAPTDQIQMDGGLVAVTETGASASKALPDALAGKFDKIGGTILGTLTVRTGSAGSVQLIPGYSANSIDYTGYTAFVGKDGTLQGYIGVGNGATLQIASDKGTWNFAGNLPTINGNGIWHAGNLDPTTKPNKSGDTYAGQHFIPLAAQTPASGDITQRVEGGSYNYNLCTFALGWPENNSSWMHLLSSTHYNTGNYYSLQIAGGFFDNANFYIRKTNNNGNAPWNTLYHSGNPQVASKAINFRSKTFLAVDYGVSENGDATANANAFNACYRDAINNGGGTVVLPAGQCQYGNTIGNYDAQQVGIRIVGGSPASQMLFIGSNIQNGLVMALARPSLEGFRIIGYGTPNVGNSALVLVNNCADPTNSWGQPIISDLAIEGNTNSIPSAFLQFHNPQFARIRGLSIVARAATSSGAGSSRGLLVTADKTSNKSSVGDWSCDGATIYGAYKGIEIQCGSNDGTPTVEGSSFTDCAIVGGSIGLHMHSQGYYAPGYTWKGGHVNVVDTAFFLQAMSQFTIADTQVYLNSAVQKNSGFVYLNDSNNCHIRHNKFFVAPQGGPGIDQNIYGVAIDGNGYQNRIEGNDFLGMNNNSPMVVNNGSGGSNRAMGNGRTGSGTQLSGNVGNMYGNHQI